MADPPIPILLVDDHPENLLAMEAVLGPIGEELVLAHSGEEALRRVLERDFAVILLDTHMPRLDGFETAALIRGRPRSAHTPIIFITAIHQEDEDVARGYEVGAVDYVFKPLVPEILRAKVMIFVELERRKRALERLAATLETRVAQRTEELHQANRRLSKIDANRTEFLSIASHDLRTPIAATRLVLENLRDGLQGPLDPRHQKPLATALRNLDRLGRMIVDLLDDARIETGRFVLEKVESDLREPIRAALEGAGALWEERGLRMELDLPEKPVVAKIDDDRVSQAVTNLLSNAARYARKRVRVALVADADRARITVEDDGPGVPPQDLPRIFDRFYRAEDGARREGLGLGLSIVKAIVEEHLGVVRVQNAIPDDGGGARFTIEFPLARALARAPRAGDLLVVEDDPDISESLRLRLEVAGYRVRIAANVAQGRAELLRAAPAVLLLDLSLPDGSGWEVLDSARGDPALADLPVVVVTAAGHPERREESLQRGVQGYFTKPYAPAELLSLLRGLAETESLEVGHS